MEDHETEVARHQRKVREELTEKAESFEKELEEEGVSPRQAETIAGEEIQVKQDLGDLGPAPGTRLTIGDQFKGKEFAPRLDEVAAHTEEAPGTCPQCGEAVTDTSDECPGCGWHIHRGGSQPLNLGVIRRDVVADGKVAFREGEVVYLEGGRPGEDQRGQKYLAMSPSLGEQVGLSDDDVFYGTKMPEHDPAKGLKDLEALHDNGILTPEQFEEAKEALSQRLAEEDEPNP